MATTETTDEALSDLLATDKFQILDLGFASSETAYLHGELLAYVNGAFTKIDGDLDSTTTTYSGTGNGTITGIVIGTETPAQTFTILCTDDETGDGVFSVTGSVSGLLGNATVGTTFSEALISLKLNDGTIDFVEGDTFTVVVSRDKGIARGICYGGVPIHGTLGLVVLEGGVHASKIVGWAELSTAEKNKAKVDLLDHGIYVI